MFVAHGPIKQDLFKTSKPVTINPCKNFMFFYLMLVILIYIYFLKSLKTIIIHTNGYQLDLHMGHFFLGKSGSLTKA